MFNQMRVTRSWFISVLYNIVELSVSKLGLKRVDWFDKPVCEYITETLDRINVVTVFSRQRIAKPEVRLTKDSLLYVTRVDIVFSKMRVERTTYRNDRRILRNILFIV